MADDCEISSEVSERWLAGRIAAALEQKPKDMFVPNGKCRWCRDDWQADQERKKRAGRIA